MQDFVNERIIKMPIETQSHLLYLNYIPQSLEKLESCMKEIPEKNKLWKVKNTVQSIEAFQCDLSNIYVVGKFAKLSDLNIGNNNRITSLEGIENCTKLKYLNCSNCNLLNIHPLAKLKKI
jgi:Leucine-rich repeat (LRR) protein